jgi:nucleoid-associated protein YgaU
MTQPPSEETTYLTKEGDTLWAIAESFYGDGNFWQIIYDVNQRTIGSDPNLLMPGLVLRISPSYITKAGDTLRSITEAFYGNGNDWQVIYNANKRNIGPDPDLLAVGLRLVIPPRPEIVVQIQALYTVRSGDTLYGIALKFYGNGNRWPDIYNENRATIGPDPNYLPVGISLFIP